MKQFYHIDCLPYMEFSTLEEAKTFLLDLPEKEARALIKPGDGISLFDEELFSDIATTPVWVDKGGRICYGKTINCY